VQRWIDLYNRKSNQPFHIPEGHRLLADLEKGFLSFEVDGEVLYVGVVSGDGRYWNEIIDQLAHKYHCKEIRFGTLRKSPAAFTRKYGYKVVGFLLGKQVR
jgi:hypothetical protein